MSSIKSKPAPGAIERDWTDKIIVIDLTNALAEEYHFEIEPDANPDDIPNRQNNDDTVLNMTLPIGVDETNDKEKDE